MYSVFHAREARAFGIVATMVKQWAGIGALLGVALLFFLFNAAVSPAPAVSPTNGGEQLIIPNHGGNKEGHTPRGFSGMGVGLFVGDNLNPNFPEGDGVQAFLTFDITPLRGEKFDVVTLSSDAAHIQGTPFNDLGNLLVESVTYDAFSRELWNLTPDNPVCILATEAADSVSCDATDAVRAALEAGSDVAQFRLRFEKAGDSDSAPDLVLFYKQNSNTNEPGIFTLQVSRFKALADDRETKSAIHVPIVVHRVVESAGASTRRDQTELEELFARTQIIWEQANIVLDVSIEETTLAESLIDSVLAGDFEQLYALLPDNDPRLHVFYVKSLLGPNGIALAPRIALIADTTSVDDFRATAHEIGHLLGLEHTLESRSRLMFPGANGRTITNNEALTAREGATALFPPLHP